MYVCMCVYIALLLYRQASLTCTIILEILITVEEYFLLAVLLLQHISLQLGKWGTGQRQHKILTQVFQRNAEEKLFWNNG